MNKSLIFSIFLFISSLSQAQVLVINELDCDTPGIDDKEFVELRSDVPNFPLDGYCVVFFNGSASGGNTSYIALDLDGYTTDINGILLIGSTTVSPFPQYLIPVNVIQNGEDALAIYQADAEDFPFGTLAYVDGTLVDVLVYGTNDGDAVGLLDIFREFNPDIVQINEGSGNNTNSIQRNNDGTYFTGAPTPRALNDGSGIPLNGLLVSLDTTHYIEGTSFEIRFTTEEVVTEDLMLHFSLSNGGFNALDFTGDTSLVMAAGQSMVTTTIYLVDDTDDEGDENMLIKLLELPPTFLPLNNNLLIRINDNDFKVAPFGTPLQPTYGVVASTKPSGYYQSLDGLSDGELKQALQNIIADQSTVRAQTYNDVIDILMEADQNPANSHQVWLVYQEKGRSKIDFQLTPSNAGVWNREHTFPRSRGGFGSIDLDTISDGMDNYWITNADSLRHANSDAHGIRAVDGQENGSRGNQFYGQYTGPAGTLGGFKGDVARGVFFLAVRYNGLDVVPGYPEGMVGQFGDLDTLLHWHRNDPPDDFEMNRNNVIYNWQRNRNPFIDSPELVEYLWGNKKGEAWSTVLSTDPLEALGIRLYPNPAGKVLYSLGIKDHTTLEILDSYGRVVHTLQTRNDISLDLNLPSGMYWVRIRAAGKTRVQKLIVE